MKKKIVSMLTATVMGLSVVACGTAQTESVSEESTAATEDSVSEASADVNESAEDTSSEAATAEESDVADAQFPMTITHGLGETVIESKPESVVAIGWGNPDVPLALGIVPTGIAEANFGPRDENGLLAWTAEAFEELGVEPNVFDDTDGWDYEAIADCNPDVILAAYSGLSQEEYDRLSEIAPVVAYPEISWTTTLQ